MSKLLEEENSMKLHEEARLLVASLQNKSVGDAMIICGLAFVKTIINHAHTDPLAEKIIGLASGLKSAEQAFAKADAHLVMEEGPEKLRSLALLNLACETTIRHRKENATN